MLQILSLTLSITATRYCYVNAKAGAGKLHSRSGSGQVKTAGAHAGRSPALRCTALFAMHVFKLIVLNSNDLLICLLY